MDNVSQNYYKLLHTNVDLSNQPTSGDPNSIIQQQINSYNDPGSVAKIETASFYNPTYQNQFKPRYEAAMAYDKLGFDPRRDNEALYNKEMSGFDSFQRAAIQTGKLSGYAALDALTFGAMSKNTTEMFSRANQIGMSTKSGLGAFVLNTMISSGYTLGIIGEALIEAVVTEALSLGTASAIEAAKLGRAFSTVYRGKKIADAARNQAKIIEGVNDLSKIKKLSEFGKKAVDFINPLENVTNFAKNSAKYSELGLGYSRGEKVAKGMTAMWNDVQAIRGAYTESLMEGNFAQKDMEDEYMMNFQAMNGRPPTEQEFNAFRENSLAANYSTAMINMPMIMLSNKMTLSPLFRPLSKMTGNTIDVLGRKSIIDISKNGVRTIKELPSGFKNRLKLLKDSPIKALKFSGEYIGENFFEGAQEIMQETISGATKEYYSDYDSGALRGSMMDYMLSNAAGQLSKQGLETFASGFLMQSFVAPITHGVGGAIRGFKGDKNTWVGKTANAVDNLMHFKDAEYQKKKEDQIEKEQKDYDKAIEEINFFFSNAANYFNGNWEELSKSSKFAEMFKDKSYAEMNDAERASVEDKMHDRLNDFVLNAIDKGYYNDMVNQLKDMTEFAKTSRDELAAEIGDVQADLMASNGDALIAKANKLKKDYDSITSYFQIPFSDEDLLDAKGRNDNYETYNKMIYVNTAYKRAVHDYVFLKDNVDLAFQKQQEILKEAQDIFNGDHKGARYDDLSTVFDRDVIADRISYLQVALNGDSGSGSFGLLSTREADRTDEMKKTINEFQEELDMLTLVRDKLNEFNDEYEKVKDKNDPSKIIERKKSESRKKKERESLKSAVRGYLSSMDMRKNNTPYRRTTTYENVAERIIQYQEFSRQNNINNENLELLTDPNIWRKNIAILAEAAKRIHGQRDIEIKNSIEAAKNAAENDALIKELYDKGIVIEDIDKLRSEKKMPSTMFDAKINREFGYLDSKYKTAYEIIKKYIPDIHDIPIAESKEDQSQGKIYGEALTIEGYKKLGIEVGKEYTAKDILNKFVNMHTLPLETIGYEGRRKLLNTLMQLHKIDGVKIKIVNNASAPLSFTNDTITIDIRYCAEEYKHKRQDMGFVLAKGIIGALTQKELENKDSEFTKSMMALYEEAKNYKANHKDEYDKLSKEYESRGQKLETYYGFKSLQDFVVESLTNERFQMYLSEIKRPSSKDSYTRNIFADFVQHVKNFINKLAGGATVLDESLSIITDFISDGETLTPYTKTSGSNTNSSTSNKSVQNKGDFEITSQTKPIDLLELNDEEKELIVNTYKENSGYTGKLTNDEILLSDDFEDWFSSKNWVVKIFINQHNANYNFEHRNEGYDVLKGKINPSLCRVESEEINEYANGNYSQQRVVITALKLATHKDIIDGKSEISSQPKVFSELEINLYTNVPAFKDKVNKLVERLIEINSKPLDDNELENAITYLSSKGFKEKDLLKLKSEDPQELLRLKAYDLTYEQKKKLISVYNTDISNLSTVKKLVDVNFEEASCLDDLNIIYDKAIKYFTSIPEALQNIVIDDATITIDYIENKYDEVSKKFIEQESNEDQQEGSEEEIENEEEKGNIEGEEITEDNGEVIIPEIVNEPKSFNKKEVNIYDTSQPIIGDVVFDKKSNREYQVIKILVSIGDNDCYVELINSSGETIIKKWSEVNNYVSMNVRLNKNNTFVDESSSEETEEHIDDISTTNNIIPALHESTTSEEVEEKNEPNEDDEIKKYNSIRDSFTKYLTDNFKNCKRL